MAGANGQCETQLELERQAAELTASNEALRQLREEDRKNQAALQRFRTALDHSADAIFLIDRASLRFIDTNCTACDRLGYSREELLGMGPQDIAPYANKQMLAARLDEIIASPESRGVIESFHKRRDGSIFPVEVRVRAIESEGHVTLVAIARDVTVQRQNEDALLKSEEQFRQITENLQHVLWIGDVASERFLYVNPAFESIWGRACSMVYKRPRMLLADIHPDDRERMTAAMQRMWHDEHVMDEEYRLLHKDGGIRWLWTRSFPIRDEKGRVYRIGAVTEDITTRREQEEKLRFSEEKYRLLFEGAPIGLGVITPDRHFIEVNPAFCNMLGYSKDELLARTIADITHPEEVASSEKRVKELFNKDLSHYVIEKRYLKKNGKPLWGRLHSTIILDRNQQPLFNLGMIEDIDQAKHAEELRQAQDAAQKKALVSEVHHRIKNHLQGVVGLLRRQLSAGSPCNPILEETIAQINAVAMVHGLQGKATGEEIGLVEMVAAISHAVDELIPSGHATRIGNALDFAPVISRDESVPIALALNELLVNARKFSSGPVDIALSGGRDKAVIRIANPTRELPQPIRASGLELVKALLQADGATFAFEHGSGRFSAEVCLTPPVLKRS